MDWGSSLRLRRHSRIGLAALVPAVVIASALLAAGKGHAEDAADDKTEANERCATRLSIALVGKSADASLMTSGDPQSEVDAMVDTPEFAERFSRYINSEFNGGPGATPADDPVYYLAKYVITNKKPWTDMFIGGYALTAAADGSSLTVKEDASGLGYFKSAPWQKRYAGNESSGLMLSAAFRIQQNTTGLTLTPSVGNPGDDRTATGRQQQPCKSCHFDAWYALDTVAHLLPTRKGQGDAMTFTAPTAGPQQLLGKSIADEKAFVEALVDSDAWRFNQCRNVFEFLYGRPENQCEAPVFDKCVDALEQTKTIQAAVAAVAKDESFCK